MKKNACACDSHKRFFKAGAAAAVAAAVPLSQLRRSGHRGSSW